MVSACVLIRTEHGRFEEVVKSISQVRGVERVFPVLGRYDVVADVKVSDMKELGAAVLKISRLSGIVFTETLVEIEH